MSTEALTVQLLGQVRVWRGAEELPLGSTQQRAVLAMLALSAGQPVSADALMAALWGDSRPASAGNVLQTYVKRLRQVLEPDRLPRTASVVLPAVGDGYCLRVDPHAVDILLARHRLAQAGEARQRDDHARVRALLSEVVDRLAAPPMPDVAVLADGPAARAIAEDRWTATGWDADAAIALGAADDVVPVLEQAVAERPFDEVFQARLLTAYRMVGRRADGIMRYHALRRRLATDLGVDPGPDVAAAYQALLHGPTETVVTPFHLPPRVGHFAGRDGELRELDRADEQIQVRVVTGPGGVGKTALALEWAYRTRSRFPDGHLYLDLRGNDPSAALSATAILSQLLRFVGVPREALAVDEAGLVALYRTLTSGGRYLIMLDNAADAAQVEALVPPTAASQLIVTSRQRFTGLATRFAVQEVTLDVLSVGEALALLRRTVGEQRLADEPEQAERLVGLCGRFPLALRIVAAQLAGRKRQTLAGFVRDLSDDRMRLARFAVRDGSLSVRTAFASTYRALSAPAAGLFRALGANRLITFTPAAAAAAAGCTPAEATDALDDLHNAHLVNEVGADRYTWHDLIQLFAQECADDDAQRRDEAADRLLDWYLHVMSVVGSRTAAFPPVASPPPRPQWRLPFGDDHVEVIRFVDQERINLTAVVRGAADRGRPDLAWRLCWALVSYFAEGHGAEGVRLGRIGLRAATALGDGSAIGYMHGFIGRSQLSEGHHIEGLGHLELALELHTEHSGVEARAIACKDLGVGNVHLRRFSTAVEFYRRSAELYEQLGQMRYVAGLVNNIADACNYLGEPQLARRHLERVAALLREQPDERNESVALTTWGESYLLEGKAAAAIDHFNEALALHRRFGNRRLEAETLGHVAKALLQLSEHAEALRRLTESMRIHRAIGNRHGEALALQQVAAVHMTCGRPAEARTCLQQALLIRRHVPYPYLEAQIHTAIAELEAGAGRPAGQARHLLEAQRLSSRVEVATDR